MSRISKFASYLNAQVAAGGVYVLGAQNDIIDFSTGAVKRSGKIISSNYTTWVKTREPAAANANAVLKFIAKRKEEGFKTVPCFDCSGLGVAYLVDQMGWFPNGKR